MKVHQREIVDRLKSVGGHVQGIQRMVEEERYCVDIIRQIQAVQRALERVSELLLEVHLQTCAAAAMRSPDPAERERAIGELLEAFQASGPLRGGNYGTG